MMTVAELFALAQTNGVKVKTTCLGFGKGASVTACIGCYCIGAEQIDPDLAAVEAIQKIVWYVADRVDMGDRLGWAFDVFDSDGAFPVEVMR